MQSEAENEGGGKRAAYTRVSSGIPLKMMLNFPAYTLIKTTRNTDIPEKYPGMSEGNFYTGITGMIFCFNVGDPISIGRAVGCTENL